MFGERSLFENFDNFTDSIEISRDVDAPTSPSIEFLKRLFAQAKELSQIIAYIWRWVDEDVNQFAKQVNAAKSLHQYFLNPGETEPNPADRSLKNLLGADPKRWLNSSEQEKANLLDKKEAELLVAVFGEDRIKNERGIFPIFDELEKSQYLITVNFNSFQGSIADPNKNAPGLLNFTIPYPPSPKFAESTVTRNDLDDWIENTKENEFTAKNPYIPTTCS